MTIKGIGINITECQDGFPKRSSIKRPYSGECEK